MWCQLDHEWLCNTHERGTITRMTEPTALGVAIGETLYRQRIARGQTQDDVAETARLAGLDWKRDHVASLENGRRRSITLEELILLSAAYQLPLADWFEGDGEIRLSDYVPIERSVLRSILGRGRPLTGYVVVDFTDVPDVDRTEQAVSHKLGVEAPDVQRAALKLWGRSFAEERDRRIGEGVAPSRLRTLRAGMTKRMTREIEPHLREQSS